MFRHVYLLNSDIDECSHGFDNCSDYAYCTNTFGGHNCTCNDGYTGDGYYCGKFHYKMLSFVILQAELLQQLNLHCMSRVLIAF